MKKVLGFIVIIIVILVAAVYLGHHKTSPEPTPTSGQSSQ